MGNLERKNQRISFVSGHGKRDFQLELTRVIQEVNSAHGEIKKIEFSTHGGQVGSIFSAIIIWNC